MESNDLFALADELRELKETKKRMEDELKACNARFHMRWVRI